MRTSIARQIAGLALVFAASGCGQAPPVEMPATWTGSGLAPRGEHVTADREELIEALATPSSRPAPATLPYRIGPGDALQVTVVGRPELSGAHRVGPDGRIVVPLARSVDVRGRTRDEASAQLERVLAPWYDRAPSVAVEVTEYRNNRVFVLGRVERPGAIELTGSGTLLEAIAEAGGLPVREFRSFLAKCAILRGREQIFWVDLIELLQRGNVALNLPLQNGDIVYLPDAEDTNVFVMGEVGSPGAIPIKVRLSLTQALAQAGSVTEDADLSRIRIARAGPDGEPSAPLVVDLNRMVADGDFRGDIELRPGDIVYVPRNGLGGVNYVLRKIAPGISTAAFVAAFVR